MNELYLWHKAQIYFKTEAKTKKDALKELYEICERVGIEIYYDFDELRDEEGNCID